MKTLNNQMILFPTTKGYIFVRSHEVIYCKSDGNYSTLYRLKDDPLFLCRQLGELETLFSDVSFFRVHYSYLVNLYHVKDFQQKDGQYLRLINGHDVPVARRRRKAFMKRFQKG